MSGYLRPETNRMSSVIAVSVSAHAWVSAGAGGCAALDVSASAPCAALRQFATSPSRSPLDPENPCPPGRIPPCIMRSSAPARRGMPEQQAGTDHITRSVVLSNLDSFHIARTVSPSSLSSGPISSSTDSAGATVPAFDVNSGLVIRSTESPRQPAACLGLRLGGGDLARSA